MRNANSGFYLVDVLAAFAAGAVGIDLQIVRLDIDFDAVIHLWNDKDGCERGVTPRSLIKRRNADQTMDADFSSQHAVSVLAGKLNGGVFDSGFFAFGFVEHLGFHSFALRPTKVHAK